MPTAYCRDVDLLIFEPNLGRQCRPAAVVAFVADAAYASPLELTVSSITSSSVAGDVVGMLVNLDGRPVTAGVLSFVDSALGVAQIDGNFDDPAARLGLPPSTGSVSVEVITFPQRWAVSREIDAALDLAGVSPGTWPAGQLRQACALGTLAAVLRTMSVIDDKPVLGPEGGMNRAVLPRNEHFARLAESYELAYRRSLRRQRLGVDLDNDGTIDRTFRGATPVSRRQ